MEMEHYITRLTPERKEKIKKRAAELSRDYSKSVHNRLRRDDAFCKELLKEMGFTVVPHGEGWKAEHVSANGTSFTAYDKTLAELASGIFDIWTSKEEK